MADFEAIGMVAESPTLLVVNAALPVKNARELVALLKAAGLQLRLGRQRHRAAHRRRDVRSPPGSTCCTCPTKGSSPGIMDTIGGTTQPHVSQPVHRPPAGQGRQVARPRAGWRKRPPFSRTPTLAEQGIANVNMTQWYALFAPAKTPKASRRAPQPRGQRDPHGTRPTRSASRIRAPKSDRHPEQLQALVKSEVARWKGVIASAKITAD